MHQKVDHVLIFLDTCVQKGQFWDLCMFDLFLLSLSPRSSQLQQHLEEEKKRHFSIMVPCHLQQENLFLPLSSQNPSDHDSG